MQDWVLNMALRWSTLCNLNGVILIQFLFFLAFFGVILYIENFLLLFYGVSMFLLNLFFVLFIFLINVVVYSFYTFSFIFSPKKICKNQKIEAKLF